MSTSEEYHQRLLAITNALITETDPAKLFRAIAGQLREVLPVFSIGIIYYDAAAGEFNRGMSMTSAGAMQSVEPIPFMETLLDGIVDGGYPVILSAEQVSRSLDRWVSLQEPDGPESPVAIILPLIGRARNILGVAAATLPGESVLTPEIREFLIQLGTQIGLSVENMLLHQENARLRHQLEQDGRYLREEINEAFDVAGLIYASHAIADVMTQVRKAASTDATVLLTGETGTGKEMFARTIHAQSRVADRPLVKVNCGAIPPGLIESTLFGHEKGAFTGAVNRHIGLFEVADQGTLFLDEIGELPLEMQVKLLRVLQEGEFTRVGGHENLHTAVRLIAATNRPLETMVKDGTFRPDLYYRIAVVPIHIPPLRERPEDVPLLATAFVQKYARRFHKKIKQISPEAMKRLQAYQFPGNVRELENLIERAVVLCDSATLGIELFPLKPMVEGSGRLLPKGGGRISYEGSGRYSSNLPAPLGTQTEDRAGTDDRRKILDALESSNWIIEGQRGAAKKLGIKPSTLRGKMSKLGIERGTN